MDISRRTALALLGSTALASCGAPMVFDQPYAPTAAIDIHNHIFNGRDVPIIGFLEQTVMREPHQPVDPSFLTTAFLRLLKTIMLIGTPTPERELENLRRRGFIAQDPEELTRQDEIAVAQGLVDFQVAEARKSARTISSLAATDGGNDVLGRLAREVGRSTSARSIASIAAVQTPEDYARSLAASIYREEPQARIATAEVKSVTRSYQYHSPMVQMIRWAGLLTRSRLDILDELVRLYGGEGGIKVFSPSLVDFTYWLRTNENVSDLLSQIEVMGALSKNYDKALVLPFVPFCPLRAELEGGDPLRNVKHAILSRGFCGVKLYPPMGFKPRGNDLTHYPWAKGSPTVPAGAIDAQLNNLYDWCARNDVPIKAHANNSIDAGPNTGLFASPEGWRAVLEEYPNLRLNLAHFGGFSESGPVKESLATGKDWEETLADMVEDFPNLYFDLSYWMEVVSPRFDGPDRVVNRVRNLMERSPKMLDRMMYGSDWSMIGKEPMHPVYLAKVQVALREYLGLTEAEKTAVMGGNAARYLGLTRNGAQRARVNDYFSGHPVYEEVFNG